MRVAAVRPRKVGLAGRQGSQFSFRLRIRWSMLILGFGVAAANLSAGTILVSAQNPAQQRRSDVLRDLPLTAFYDTPRPLPAGKAGELIRWESFDDYDLPATVSAVRILYHSQSANGEDVASSAVVLYPSEAKPPAGGWPIIAWAHGATGVARTCAPSLSRNLGHGPFFSMYVNLGYAIVATDYTGLGTNFRNAFLDNESNANDLVNSIPAARTAVPQLGSQWIIMGEAEGGLAAEKVAEKENSVREYLGSIVISGFASARELYDSPTRPPSAFQLLSLVYGIGTVYPQFRANDILSKNGTEHYHEIERVCTETETATELAAEIVKPGWENERFVARYLARNSPGQTRAYGPILAITDGTNSSAQAIARLCKLGDHVQWEQYPDQNSGSVIGDSVRDQIAWIEDRFAGRNAPNNCR